MREIEGDVSNLFLHMKVVQCRSLLLTREIFLLKEVPVEKACFGSSCNIIFIHATHISMYGYKGYTSELGFIIKMTKIGRV